MKRGYFSIGIYHPKTVENVGTLWRSAFIMGAAYIFTIGKRYKKQPSDTVCAWRHIPLMEFETWEDFKTARPSGSLLVAVENSAGAKPVRNFCHPERAVYILGSEDHGLPDSVLSEANHTVILPGDFCLNVATSGSIIMFDRIQKQPA